MGSGEPGEYTFRSRPLLVAPGENDEATD